MLRAVSSKCLWVLLSLLFPMGAVAQSLKVTLLGTGHPTPSIERFGPSILVEAGSERLLFDCGRGATIRLWQLHIPLSAVTAIFFTHLHSDHVVGFPDLWLTGWLPTAWGRRAEPMHVYGPIGTKKMMRHLEEAYQADIRIRIADERLPRSGVTIITT